MGSLLWPYFDCTVLPLWPLLDCRCSLIIGFPLQNVLVYDSLHCRPQNMNKMQWHLFKQTPTEVKHKINTVFCPLAIEINLDFWRFLLKSINAAVLIRCEEVGKNRRINKQLPSCIKHLRILHYLRIYTSIYVDLIKYSVEKWHQSRAVLYTSSWSIDRLMIEEFIFSKLKVKGLHT